MIRINLLKHAVAKRSSRPFPVVGVVIAGIAVVCVVALIVSGIGLAKIYLRKSDAKKEQPVAVAKPVPSTAKPPVTEPANPVAAPETKPTMKEPPSQPVAVVKEAPPAKPVEKPAPPKPASIAPAPKVVTAPAPKPAPPVVVAPPTPAPVEKGYLPSADRRPGTVEEVAEAVGKSGTRQKSGDQLVALAYGEMSRGEKVNYEYWFTKNIFQLLARAVPDGIGFTTLSVDGFTTISAVGFGSNREQVVGLFSALRGERLQLSGQPKSNIRPSVPKGYGFSFTGETSFGAANPGDQYILTDHLEPRENLQGIIRSFVKETTRSGVILQDAPLRVGSEKTGDYRRFTYHITGRSTYRNFVKFVLQLNAGHIPCAFSRIRLNARGDAHVDIAADVVFTTRE
jgi:outer membrane biosynthesis protein TonB